MPIVVIPPEAFRRMPWKNGRGVTTEVARSPEGDGEFDWRISIAGVTEDGPFSHFPSCDRVLVVLEGAGIRLVDAASGRVARLAPLEPWSFGGERDTVGELVDGPIRDFNVMTRRGTWRSKVEVIRSAATADGRVGPLVVFAQSGQWIVRAADEQARLPPGSAAIADRCDESLVVKPHADAIDPVALRVRLEPNSPNPSRA